MGGLFSVMGVGSIRVERGFGIPGGGGLGVPGAGRARGIGSRGLCRTFRARRPSGLGARWLFAGLAGRGRGS